MFILHVPSTPGSTYSSQRNLPIRAPTADVRGDHHFLVIMTVAFDSVTLKLAFGLCNSDRIFSTTEWISRRQRDNLDRRGMESISVASKRIRID